MNLKKSVAEILTNGYLTLMALFFVVTLPAIKLGWTLSKLAWIWVLLIVILVLTFVMAQNVARKSDGIILKPVTVIVMLLSVVVSVGFTRPYAQDATLEMVNTMLETGSIGQGLPSIELMYAALVELVGAESAVVLYYVLPVFLLGFFFAGIWRLGSALLEENQQVAVFELFVIGIYWMTTFLEGQSVVTGIFLNSWNGLTWLSCFVMPVVFANCLDWMNQARAGRIQGKIEKICMSVIMLLAGQLTNDKGGFYVALMLFLTVAVIIVRKGYDYGIASGRFKKRV